MGPGEGSSLQVAPGGPAPPQGPHEALCVWGMWTLGPSPLQAGWRPGPLAQTPAALSLAPHGDAMEKQPENAVWWVW